MVGVIVGVGVGDDVVVGVGEPGIVGVTVGVTDTVGVTVGVGVGVGVSQPIWSGFVKTKVCPATILTLVTAEYTGVPDVEPV
jgi:hypothetical protein